MFGFFQSALDKIKTGLRKTRSLLASKVYSLFSKPWQESTFEELERILYESDLGTQCAIQFTEQLKNFLKKNPKAEIDEILNEMKSFALQILEKPSLVAPKVPEASEPLVILVAGVNGSGKTTSIAKLANSYQKEGKKVLIAAADTFRAAAIDQLSIWAEKTGVQIVKSLTGSDPSAVVFDALSAAKARNVDIVIIDTAGRLQNKTDLMHELEKMKRVCTKVFKNAPHESFLVLDATTGQNAIDQAKIFNQFLPLTGIILAKLDGSSKGGIVLSIYQQMGIPIRYIGIGEKMDDLAVFDAKTYTEALFDPYEK